MFDVKMTDPASTVLSSAELESDGCALEGLPDAAVRVRGNLRELRFEVVGFGDGGRAVGTVRMRAGTGTTTVDVIDRLGEKITDLTITITLSGAGASEQERFREHGFLYRVTVRPYVAQIEVSSGDGQHGVVDCEASYVVERVIATPPGEDAGH